MKSTAVIAMLTLPLFAACGGSDDHPCVQFNGSAWVPCQASSNTAIPEGFWTGNTSTGLATSMLVLETGQYFIVPTATNAVGLVEGTFTATSGNFSDTNSVVFPQSGIPVTATTTGTFSARQSLSGTVAAAQPLTAPFSGTTGVTFSTAFNSLYDTPASASQAQGTWSGTIQSSSAPVTLTFAANGSFTGINGGCTFIGSVTPRSTGKNVLDGTVSFQSNACPLPAGTSMSFEAVVSGNQLFAAGVTAQRNQAFVIAATKG